MGSRALLLKTGGAAAGLCREVREGHPCYVLGLPPPHPLLVPSLGDLLEGEGSG